jgi:L-alanine-DL-glutamate epimerase-like enolase superfamily enzyme
LGGARDWAPTYCTFFHEYDREQLIEAAKLQVGNGHSRLKMVVGVHKQGWQEDAKRVRGVRDAIGPDVELMMDANYKFNPVDARVVPRGRGLQPDMVRRALIRTIRAPRRFAPAYQIPIAAGQNEAIAGGCAS